MRLDGGEGEGRQKSCPVAALSVRVEWLGEVVDAERKEKKVRAR